MSNYLCGAGEKGALPAPTPPPSRPPAPLRALKEALEEAGRSYGEGPYLWGNYRLLPRSEWPEAPAPDPAGGENMETVAYADLLDEANGERGVTLRLPVGLHAALVKAAEDRSFNQFCVNTLYAALHMVSEGPLEVLPEGLGFMRQTVGEPYDEDVYVSQTQIRCFGLQSGDIVRGEVRPPRDAEKYYGFALRQRASTASLPVRHSQRARSRPGG